MLTDAHCHPYDLSKVFPQGEDERSRLGVTIAASSCDLEEFSYNESLTGKATNTATVLPCFAVHPQLPALKNINHEPHELVPLVRTRTEKELDASFKNMEKLASQGKIAAVGECGFDFFNKAFKNTEKIQESLFNAHIETALRYNLPVVIHARKAMHKIFAAVNKLAKCRAVIFHSWPGTFEEGQSLLRRGVNAYFSFGNVIMLNHKQAMQSCALFPAERLLTETDAPYQPQRGKTFSHWADLPLIIETAAKLRSEAQSEGKDAKELEDRIEANFRAVFGI